MKGYVQVYTGDGKGKTTAALGLAMRAAGAGLKTHLAQFVKGMACSELESLKRFPDLIAVHQYGRGYFLFNDPEEKDIEAARAGFAEVKDIVASGEYDVVILDEINIATYYGLVSVDEVLALIDAKPENVELVLTGRKADPRIIEAADLVTEMREVKHYYAAQGVRGRKGIEK